VAQAVREGGLKYIDSAFIEIIFNSTSMLEEKLFFKLQQKKQHQHY